MKVYGPYLRKDGRKHVILYKDGKRSTVSYPKFLMEQHLGRKLKPHETVDHIDRDFTNDDITNLRVVDRSQHAKDDAKRVKYTQVEELTCVWCGCVFTPDYDNLRYRKESK